MKTISFAIAPERIKHLRINLAKKVQVLYIKNYKISLKELKTPK